MSRKKNRAQSTVEYILVVTAILAAIIVVTGKMFGRVKTGMNSVSVSMERTLNVASNKFMNIY